MLSKGAWGAEGRIMHLVYMAIKRLGETLRVLVLGLCISAFPSTTSFLETVSAEEPSATEQSTTEQFSTEPPVEEPTLEELEPQPLNEQFAIKLLEKIIELEDALWFMAGEVGEMKNELAEKVSEMEERIAKLEAAPPGPMHVPGEPPAPPTPAQTRFEEGDVYLGHGFKIRGLIYETTPDGTVFKGEMVNNSSAGKDIVEFEIVVFDGDGRMLGTKAFKLHDVEIGEARPFETLIKGPKAHWVKKYDMRYLRGS